MAKGLAQNTTYNSRLVSDYNYGKVMFNTRTPNCNNQIGLLLVTILRILQSLFAAVSRAIDKQHYVLVTW